MRTSLFKGAFGYHLTAFLIINAVLIWINIETFSGNSWFVWPLLGWGAALAIHGLVFFSAERNRFVSFRIHSIVFILSNILLLFANISYSPDYLWFKFPLVAWGLLMIFHAWTIYSKKGIS